MDSCEKNKVSTFAFLILLQNNILTYNIAIAVKYRPSDETACEVEEDLDGTNPGDIGLGVCLELVFTVPLLVNAVF